MPESGLRSAVTRARECAKAEVWAMQHEDTRREPEKREREREREGETTYV